MIKSAREKVKAQRKDGTSSMLSNRMIFKLATTKLLMKFAQNCVLRRFSFKVEPTWKVHTIKQSVYI